MEHEQVNGCIVYEPKISMMHPPEIQPSLFGEDINPVASAADDLALGDSIAANGVQVAITAGRIDRKGKYHVVKGTRRHKQAIERGISSIPVELKEYSSLEEMRQDAIRDNLERRHLSTTERAELANHLWRSYENAPDKKDMAAKGIGPRKRAATAGGISEGTLANFRYVLDSSDDDLISKMRSGALSIDKACREAKTLTDGKFVSTKITTKSSVSEPENDFRDSFGDLVQAAATLRETVKRVKVAVKLVKQGQVNDSATLIKQIQAVTQTIAALSSNTVLTKFCDITSTKDTSTVDMDTTLADQEERKGA